MKKKIIFQDLGLVDYKKAWDYQEKLFNKVLDEKSHKDSEETTDNYLLFCEHPHVYTLGKSGAVNNLLINDEFLQKINATFYKIDRGGDITYHGPGQIVGYPILDLDNFNLHLKKYIFNIEQAIIDTLKDYSIEANRLQGSTGVWLDVNDKSRTRKICAIGVRASHWVTMHGFAFNINTNLDYFNYINPCGFTDIGVTSLEKELGRKIDIEEVKKKLKIHIVDIFEAHIIVNG